MAQPCCQCRAAANRPWHCLAQFDTIARSRKKIAIYGGSLNPPGLHHRQIAKVLNREFTRTIVVPCGPRADKPTVNDVDPVHRAALADIAFRGLDRVEVDLFDLEQAAYSTTDMLQDRYRNLSEIWHVIGSDLTAGGRESAICKDWEGGAVMLAG